MDNNTTVEDEDDSNEEIESRISALYVQGLSLNLRNSNPARALVFFDRALELSSQIDGGSMNIKNILVEKARTLTRIGSFYEADLCFREVIEIDKVDSLSWSSYGDFWYRRGKHDRALMCYDQALRYCPKELVYDGGMITEAAKQVKEADLWIAKARVFIKLGDFNKVVECYKKVLELNPERKEVWYLISHCLHFKLNRSEEALTTLDRYLKLVKEDPKAWLLRGGIFSRLGNHEDAAICFSVTTSIDPNNIEAWYRRGLGHLILKEYTLAISCFENIVDSNVYHKDEILALMGNSYYYLGDYEPAQEKCEQALLLNRDNEMAKWTLRRIK